MLQASVLLWILASPTPPAPCIPPRISAEASALLRPVLSEYLLAHSEEFDRPAGRFRGPSPHSPVFDERFERLLATPGSAASEAIAALMCFYVGEHQAEELVCEAIKRGKHIRVYLQRFRHCPPVTGLEPIDPFFTGIPNLREEALNLISRGRAPCEYE
jgi:hypothetical protein